MGERLTRFKAHQYAFGVHRLPPRSSPLAAFIARIQFRMLPPPLEVLTTMKRIFAFALTCALTFGVLNGVPTLAVAQLVPSSPPSVGAPATPPLAVPLPRPPTNPAK